MVAMFNEKLQADVPFLRDVLALHAMDVYSKNSTLAPARPKAPQELWDAFSNS